MSEHPQTPWSALGDGFLSEGEWAIGQGPDAPDRQLLRKLLRLSGPTQLLEVGCGPGIEVVGLEQDGLLVEVSDGNHDHTPVSYVGYDFTPELVDVCRARFPLRFEVRDVLTMADSGVADIVWARHLLEHVSDGELALRNLWQASRRLLIVSWFIRPTWRPDEAGCVVADGFQHWTYDAPRWVSLASEMGAHLYRFDIDHHANRGSVWILARRQQAKLVEQLHAFMQSPEFLAAIVPVPPDPQERLNDALDALERARDAIAAVIPVVERVDDLDRLLQDDGQVLGETFGLLSRIAAGDDETTEAAGRVNEAWARTKAAFSDKPPRDSEAVQAARDAQARVEAALETHRDRA